MYIYIYVRIHVYICTCVYIRRCTYTLASVILGHDRQSWGESCSLCKYTHIYISSYTYIFTNIYNYKHICKYTYIRIHIYVCIYMCVYMYRCAYTQVLVLLDYERQSKGESCSLSSPSRPTLPYTPLTYKKKGVYIYICISHSYVVHPLYYLAQLSDTQL